MNADDRQQVRLYYTPLWIWNRLEKERWSKVKLVLREKSRRRTNLEVDHIVAWDLWQSKLKVVQPQGEAGPTGTKDFIEELSSVVNELGNCMLLEKNFNISKSNKPLKEFLNEVHEFKSGALTIDEWAIALDLGMSQVDSAGTALEELRTLFGERTQKIRADLEQFIRGAISRVDLEAT